jgi:protein involved in polysaccharide export with SLBB domain
MKFLYSIIIISLCLANSVQAAGKKKPRDKNNEPAPVSAPAIAPQGQPPAAKDTSIGLPAATQSRGPDTVISQSASTPTVQTAAIDKEGFVKPGEAIRIYAFPDSSSFVNGFYPVDGGGRIYLPIIGKMNVMGITEKAFLDTLKAQYINYLRYPNIQIRHSIRISLLGGFQRPGLYYIDPDYSLWDAVYLAGGTIREDGLKRMQWERDRTPVTTDIVPYYQSGQSLRTIGFQSGDQLWTPVEPKRSWWEIAVRDVVLSQIFPILTTSASLYVSYMMYKSYKNR